MKRRVLLAASTILVTMVGPGCEDAAKKPAQAHVPGTPAAAAHVAAPSPTWQSQTAQQPAPPLAPLPLTDPKRQPPKSLLAPLPDGKNYLMQKVQEKFASGEQNFKAGRLEAARKDFDDAVDWMLESGYDPDGDAVLSALFHHVVDSVYAYELQAVRGGEGFTQAAAVPAPIDEVAAVTLPADPRLKERAEEAAKSVSHDLPLTVNDEVLSFVNFFQTPKGRDIVENGLRRGGRYRDMILRVLKEEGVPQDLIYLAQAESAFQPLALSRAGARGIWQFVAYRGQQYGLRRTWWIDERQDAEHYNILADPEAPVPSDVVKPGRPIDLRLVAETIDVDVETLRALNPALLRMATPDDPSFELHLPRGTGEKFTAEIAAIPPDKWISWRRHRVEAGETLASMAKKYRVTVAAIAEANNIERTAALEPGMKLTIPATQSATETKRLLLSYRVRRGDTLAGIADRFSVDSEDVRRWNRLRSNRVSRGMVLRIYTLGGAPQTD